MRALESKESSRSPSDVVQSLLIHRLVNLGKAVISSSWHMAVSRESVVVIKMQ